MSPGLYVAQQVINAVSLGSLYALVADRPLDGLRHPAHDQFRPWRHDDGGRLRDPAPAAALGLPFGWAVVRRHGRRRARGRAVERIAYRPVRGSPDVTLLLTSLAVTYILENLGILLFTSSPRNFPVPGWLDGAFQLVDGAITFTAINLLTVALTLVALLLLGWFVTRTDVGLGMRAAAEDMTAAQLVGLDVNLLIVVAFAIASAFAGLGGRAVGRTVGRGRAHHGLHATAQGLRRRDHRRLRQHRRGAARRLPAGRARGLHRRLPALAASRPTATPWSSRS